MKSMPNLQSLLRALFKVVHNNSGVNSSNNNNSPTSTPLQTSVIKTQTAITALFHALQCLGIRDLKSILPTIVQSISSFGTISQDAQIKLLKIIIDLMKRISKTEDCQIRGELHLALTKILPFCHDTGFHFRMTAAKAEPLIEDEEQEQSEETTIGQGDHTIEYNHINNHNRPHFGGTASQEADVEDGEQKDNSKLTENISKPQTLSLQSNHKVHKSQAISLVSKEFFRDFWELQTYFMDPSELIATPQTLPSHSIMQDKKSATVTNNGSGNSASTNSGNTNNGTLPIIATLPSFVSTKALQVATATSNAQLLPLRLRRIYQTLQKVQTYLQSHPPSQQQCLPTLSTQPLKYVKNRNLLSLQLTDPHFLKVVMLQCMIFVNAVRTNPVKWSLVLGEGDRDILTKIDDLAVSYLSYATKRNNNNTKDSKKDKHLASDKDRKPSEARAISNQQATTANEASPYEPSAAIKALPTEFQAIFQNEAYWVDLKEHWKERRKTQIKQRQKGGSFGKIGQAVNKKREEAVKELATRMKGDGEKMKDFLKADCKANLTTEPTIASFAAYYDVADEALGSFDTQAGVQTIFSTRSEYNLLEWKALRSIYRESMSETCKLKQSSIHPKIHEYPLLVVVAKRKEAMKAAAVSGDGGTLTPAGKDSHGSSTEVKPFNDDTQKKGHQFKGQEPSKRVKQQELNDN